MSEVKFSNLKAENGELRIEAEHFLKKYDRLKELLSNHNCVNLSDLVSKPIQTGHTPSMKNECFYGGNIKFIKTDNLRDNDIKFPFSHYLSELGNAEIKRTELQEDDIITTIIGATYDVIARSCIIHKNILPANINQNIAHIRPNKKKILPEYLNIYLNSKYGKMYLEYLSRQMEQVNLNCEEVGLVKVPLFSSSFQFSIEQIVKSAHAKLAESKALYAEAEEILLSELGLKDWQPGKNSHTDSILLTQNQDEDTKDKRDSVGISNPCDNIANYSIKRFSDFASSGRLDAEYYQPKYDEIEEKIRKSSHKEIFEVVTLKDSNFSPLPKKLYKYIELANIGASGEITGFTEDYGENLPTRARRIVHTGDLLISSIEGSLQSCAIVTGDYDDALCSTGFYVVTPKLMNAETLLILLKSDCMQSLLKKGCSGTILTAIAKDEFLKIPLPLLPESIQSLIAEKIQKSFDLRKQSKQLLEQAKRMVEEEIEKQ